MSLLIPLQRIEKSSHLFSARNPFHPSIHTHGVLVGLWQIYNTVFEGLLKGVCDVIMVENRRLLCIFYGHRWFQHYSPHDVALRPVSVSRS